MLQVGVRRGPSGLRRAGRRERRAHFSAGANLMLVLLEAQEANWDEIDLLIRTFQQATLALRLPRYPSSCGAGRAGARRRLRDCPHGDRVQAAGRNLHGPGGGGRRH